MTTQTVRQRLLNQMYEAKERINADKILEQCSVNDKGQLIRGYVTKVKCAGCGHDRWDDGTPCRQITSFNKICGHRVVADLSRMEDGRIG